MTTRYLILKLVVSSQLLTISVMESPAQDIGSKVLVAEKRNSSKQITFSVGQSAKYKTTQVKGLQKGVIHEITDSTISFSSRKRIVVVPFRDLKELKAIRSGRKAVGTALVVTGIAGLLFGLVALPPGGGSPEGAGLVAVIAVGSTLFVTAGVVVLKPDVANTSTLKAQTMVKEKKK